MDMHIMTDLLAQALRFYGQCGKLSMGYNEFSFTSVFDCFCEEGKEKEERREA